MIFKIMLALHWFSVIEDPQGLSAYALVHVGVAVVGGLVQFREWQASSLASQIQNLCTSCTCSMVDHGFLVCCFS